MLIHVRSVKSIRAWAFPVGEKEPWPTPRFYVKRSVYMSNIGTDAMPMWIALDTDNEHNLTKKWRVSELIHVRNKLRRNGGFRTTRLHPYEQV